MKKMTAAIVALGAIVMPGVARATEPAQWSLLGNPITGAVKVLASGTFALAATSHKHIVCTSVHGEMTVYPGGAFTNPFEANAGTDERLVTFGGCEDLSTGAKVRIVAVPLCGFLVRAEAVIADVYVPCEFFETGTKVFAEVELPEGSGPVAITSEEPIVGVVAENKLQLGGNLEIAGEPIEWLTEVELNVAAGEPDEGEPVRAE